VVDFVVAEIFVFDILVLSLLTVETLVAIDFVENIAEVDIFVVKPPGHDYSEIGILVVRISVGTVLNRGGGNNNIMLKVENKRRYYVGCTELIVKADIDWLEEKKGSYDEDSQYFKGYE
jgi:hypothetical protein